ncbi:MAG: 3-hydroxyacyl-ACP dehydratase FabZ [Dissulfurimicrobium sp.]|uniref:3-hydroxyacyl-ACP dehydratase FabZ n=1 Tax=Dissulfurimicrobium TaxID=1769732 RepID=UPI003C75548F
MMHSQGRFDMDDIMSFLPHRYPFLLVDRILSLEPGKSITGLKNVTMNEPFFQGHFPGFPIMPGVLILEAMAQTGIIFAKASDQAGLNDKFVLFAGLDEVRFRRPVIPGDQLIMELTLLKHKASIWKMAGKATVGGELAVEAQLIASMSDGLPDKLKGRA